MKKKRTYENDILIISSTKVFPFGINRWDASQSARRMHVLPSKPILEKEEEHKKYNGVNSKRFLLSRRTHRGISGSSTELFWEEKKREEERERELRLRD